MKASTCLRDGLKLLNFLFLSLGTHVSPNFVLVIHVSYICLFQKVRATPIVADKLVHLALRLLAVRVVLFGQPQHLLRHRPDRRRLLLRLYLLLRREELAIAVAAIVDCRCNPQTTSIQIARLCPKFIAQRDL